MKALFKKLIYILTIAALVIGAADMAASAAPRKGKASTSQTSKSKKKKSSKKSSTSKKKKKRKKNSSRSKSKKKRTSHNRKSTKKRTAARRYSRPAPPPDPVLSDSLTLAVDAAIKEWIPARLNPGGLRVNSVKLDSAQRSTKVSLNENYTYLPVTNEFIKELQKEVKAHLPHPFDTYPVYLSVGRHSMAYYITKVDKLPEQYRGGTQFVVESEPCVHARKGMEGDIVGLWSSHGRYFKGGAWQWQRPLLFETVEDLYTMGYILPFTVPMLENAGAYVMLPRERDTNVHEVIVDNDTNPDGQIYSQPYYKEQTGTQAWRTGDEDGFIYDLPDFRDTENPFENGTYRETTTVKGGKPSVAAWYADIPEDGEYAVYVSYKSLPNSTSDARYTVNYSGGSKEFKVNQKMGGGTWIYLGTFPLEAGYSDTEPVVTLTNLSSAEGKTLTADAVKIGGGMGNIARSSNRSDIYYDPSTPDNSTASESSEDDEEEGDEEEETDDEAPTPDEEGEGDVDSEPADTSVPAEPLSATMAAQSKGRAPVFRTSGMPRYVEGARYWLHWAGAPESVYSPYHGSNDYKDDYTSRGNWINWLAGGSRVIPDGEGLGIPVDVCMALHSDAGKRSDDSFVGTLGIYFSNGGDSYEDGTPRINSRMLTDMLMRQITGDIRKTYEPNWTRRSMWDKSYVEARVPEVPTSLIELMSHQNFADMKYGLDPGFRFWVGRAIYKALGRFMAERKNREFVVQPLPVKDFSIKRTRKNHYRLSWEPTEDPVEPTATPKKYIVLERSGDELGFHKIGETHSTHFDVKTADNEIHSFRIVAANDGGLAFPSETLAMREAENDSEPVLIVNGFTRVSGPESFSEGGSAGFRSEDDFGVPYLRDISFAGHQTEFRRCAGESFGRSSQNYATKVIAGNTFDYPYLHGESFARAGYGFVSSSASAVEKGDVKLHDYKTVDLILGKQKRTTVGNGKSGTRYEAFPVELQKKLRAFAQKGGDIMVSGQYLVSDASRTGEGADFLNDVLGVEADSIRGRNRSGSATLSIADGDTRRIDYSNTLNEKNYIVEAPDALLSTDRNGRTVLTLSDTGAAAGLLTRKGKSRKAVFSLPLEAIPDASVRDRIVKGAMDYFNER